MGTWGHGGFENDDAMDWVYALEESADTTVVEQALDLINTAHDYLEAPECDEAIAAAEVVAALRGKPSASLPEAVVTWLQGKPAPPAALARRALAALDRIMESSELKDLWAEGKEPAKWQAAIDDLRSRLG